jgi:hypothetical protein
MRNLAALERRGLRCAYGFWEALDLTPCRAPAGGRVVRCVMAHPTPGHEPGRRG